MSIVLQRLLNEAQQMLLIHAGRRVNVSVNFADVVEIAMRNRLLGGQLAELVQKNVQLEL